MSNQDVFNGLSSNWLYASMSSMGAVRVHTEKPELLPKGGMRFNKDATCRRTDLDPHEINVSFTGEIWERSQPLVGAPPYATDGKGVALDQPATCEPAVPQVPECPQPSVFAPAPQPMAPPATVYITVDQAESGSLWDFANPDENYVTVNTYGAVWFNRHKGAAYDRRSYAVCVNGVTHPIERTRSHPQVSPPEAGKPFASLAVDYPAPGLREDGGDAEHGWTNELEEAKERAQRLFNVYVHDGGNTRPALNEMQYMAIFGELPE